MNQTPSSAPIPSGAEELPAAPARVDIVLATFREDAWHYFYRLVWGALAALAMLALSHWWLEEEGAGFSYFLLIALGAC